MRVRIPLGLAALIWTTAATTHCSRNYDTHDYYALHLDRSISVDTLASSLGLEHEGQLGELEDHYIFSVPRREADVVDDAIQELRRRRRKRSASLEPHPLDSILFSQKQKLKPRMEKRWVPSPREARAGPQQPEETPVDSAIEKQQAIARDFDIKDPIFKDQWHLYNPIQLGHDVNVTDVWRQGITGHNATVAIVDDGLDMYSDDLKDNYFAEGSYDFNDKGPEPKPRLDDDKHGTRCAGEIAAVKNNVCGVGVAWNAKVAGIRILSKQISDADEAAAMNYAFDKNQIYSCSWGPPDDGQSMDAPGILIKKAFVNAVQRGRNGLGSIYVFASGNGAANDDNCNFDGYTNSIYSITVGAVDRKGLHPYYSEKCSAQLVVTYSSGSGDAIHTTDVGTNKCYSQHGGTSAAAPLAAGIFSLVLSARPDLGWRDLQYLAMQTAVPFDEEDTEWQNTTAGYRFSHKFGYGKLDAWAIVEAAKDFQKVKPQAWFNSPWMHVKRNIPQGDQGLASHYKVTEGALQSANLERLEHVTVTMNVQHARRGDLSVELHSPNGIVSRLSATRRNDKATTGYVDWTFMSVVHWGESGVGDWVVIVKDTEVNEFNGTFTDWKLTLWGESIDANEQELLPMPTEHDDDDHDVTSTIPGSVSTTSVSIPTDEPTVTENPEDHPDRPVNDKPDEPASTPSSGFLPSFFPTFGLTPHTQLWLYGSLTLIILFCCGIAVYFYLARRKRLRDNPRDDYEFEMLEDQEEVGGVGGRRRRAGELYDAFAEGESDEDVFLSDEEEGDEAGDDGGYGYGNEGKQRLQPEAEEERALMHNEKQG
ncbi:MAG: pheromone processing endoprotease [Vezdaea acicularis]|nr:MAG: pheromone processing endoprotease [Vezdaea acicularis]